MNWKKKKLALALSALLTFTIGCNMVYANKPAVNKNKRFVSMAELQRRSAQHKKAQQQQSDNRARIANAVMDILGADSADENEEVAEAETSEAAYDITKAEIPGYSEEEVISILSKKMDKSDRYDNIDLLELVQTGKYAIEYEEKFLSTIVSATNGPHSSEVRKLISLNVDGKNSTVTVMQDYFVYEMNIYFNKKKLVFAEGKALVAEGDDCWTNKAALKNDESSISMFLNESMLNAQHVYQPNLLVAENAMAIQEDYVKQWLLPTMNQSGFVAFDKQTVKNNYKPLGSSQIDVNGMVLRCDTYKHSFMPNTFYEYYYQGNRLIAVHYINDFMNDTLRNVTENWYFIYSYKPIV